MFHVEHFAIPEVGLPTGRTQASGKGPDVPVQHDEAASRELRGADHRLPLKSGFAASLHGPTGTVELWALAKTASAGWQAPVGALIASTGAAASTSRGAGKGRAFPKILRR